MTATVADTWAGRLEAEIDRRHHALEVVRSFITDHPQLLTDQVDARVEIGVDRNLRLRLFARTLAEFDRLRWVLTDAVTVTRFYEHLGLVHLRAYLAADIEVYVFAWRTDGGVPD